ncbi:hypothetical protein L249_5259 [Ophiocordyceps polyrhachis-furcata BCC 54312]|uniref:LDB19 N-terminal domain-containing protein n=1 Tax=Ophiocordyceps polyrhachis-furcata BCC 54312 TaxID=1330021 RepID=A0A367L9B9_9HYPO|nr:hypothetical protein L249_5259 [Ophiocordyceps polyrhachis-furcata BCC 54312]
MPHRVTNFLPSSASSASASASASSPKSDSDKRNNIAFIMPRNHLNHHHILSLPFSLLTKDHHHHHHHHHHPHYHRPHLSPHHSPVRLDWSIESPPIVFHGSPEESTGALISGQMLMDVSEDSVQVQGFSASLSLRLTQKRPYQGHCCDCQHQTRELKSWRLLTKPATLTRGRHLFPFSALLDGRLPACLDTSVVVIEYVFKAQAILGRPHGRPPVCIGFSRFLDVKRSLPEPLYPHHSVRVFPPTNIKASAHYSSVIHPTSSNPMTLKLDGLMSRNVKTGTVDIWRLKKVTWRLEETIKTYAPACQRHAPPSSSSSSRSSTSASSASASSSSAHADDDDDDDADDDDDEEEEEEEDDDDDDEDDDDDDDDDMDDDEHSSDASTSSNDGGKKRICRVSTRTLREKQLHNGWKSDFSGCDGTVDMEFNFGVPVSKPHSREPTYACDTKTRDGTEVTHSLLIELIVSKEFAPEGKPQLATQTGTGRILRMHFAVVMTEFPGLGVSWDNEAPPVYQDVPPRPPGYPYEPPIEYDQLEALDARA